MIQPDIRRGGRALIVESILMLHLKGYAVRAFSVPRAGAAVRGAGWALHGGGLR